MVTTLIAGANSNVPTSNVVIRVTSGVPADVSAFRLYNNAKTKADDDFIFYGQKSTLDGTIKLISEGTNTQFSVILPALPSDIEKIAFTITVDNGRVISILNHLNISVEVNNAPIIDCPVTLAGRSEAALILGELYRRGGEWKFRFIDQGFNGGLAPLAEHFGVEVDHSTPAPPSANPHPIKTVPVNLNKVTLTKNNPTISLSKSVNLSKADGFGRIRVNLNWNQTATNPKSRIAGSLNGLTGQNGIDLDLGGFIHFKNGTKSLVQALGNAFGNYNSPPYIELEADDRTGANRSGEWININGTQWDNIDEVIIFTFIYEGAPNWAATDGVVTLHIPHQPPIETHLTEGSNRKTACAIARLKNINNTITVERLNQYFDGHQSMDIEYGWGFKWTSGSKLKEGNMLDWARNKFQQGQEALRKEISRFKNKDFMRSCIAVGTYIAYADGNVSSEEKQKLIKYFEISDALKVFSTNEVIEEFKAIAEKFEFDFDIGKSEALKVIGKIRSKQDEARAAIRLGVMIAKSDNNFDDSEKQALMDVCHELNIKPEEFF